MMSDNRKRILVTDSMSSVGVSKLEEFCEVDCNSSIAAQDLMGIIGDYNGLVVRGRTKVTAELIEIADQLEVVGRCGVGVDNIDIDACIQKGVVVVNSPRAPSIAVAELTIGLMLSLARRITYCDREVKDGKWPKSEIKGFELYGKTLGLIAMGRIGTEVARLANAFNMRVIGSDPYVSKERFAECNVLAVDYDELLGEADYISIHAPLTKETLGMIDMAAISIMKDGVRIISASRGGLINENDLLEGLELGKIAGAALDVLAEEPPSTSKLIGHPNIIVTPHIGAQTAEAQARAGIDVAEEVIAALKGEKLRWSIG